MLLLTNESHTGTSSEAQSPAVAASCHDDQPILGAKIQKTLETNSLLAEKNNKWRIIWKISEKCLSLRYYLSWILLDVPLLMVNFLKNRTQTFFQFRSDFA